jgi:DNA invertase Pin-like site-specific DNA recombinase
MKGRYIRISSGSQSTARQHAIASPDERLYVDTISGSVAFKNRPAGQQLLQDIEAGLINYISFSQLDRCGRSAIDIQNVLDYFRSKGVTVKIDNLGVESLLPDGKPNPSFKMITDILANLSEMQKESILENQAQGIAAAKQRGDVYKGRVAGTSESDEDVLAKYKQAVKVIKMHPELSLRKLEALTGVSMNTVKKIKGILDKEKGNL